MLKGVKRSTFCKGLALGPGLGVGFGRDTGIKDLEAISNGFAILLEGVKLVKINKSLKITR